MNIEEYNSIADAMDKAEEDVTPFAVLKDNEVTVVGDANRTEVAKHDYKILFRVVKDGKYEWSEQEFKNVYITPRMDTKVTRLLTEMQPYFKKPDGEKFTRDDAMKIIENDDLLDLMYNVVASVLNIPANLANYMEPASVITAAKQIMLDFPNAVNEANTFFK